MGTDALDAMLYAISSGELYTRIASYNGPSVETYMANENDGIKWPRLSIDNWSATVEAYMQFFENIANHPIKFDTYVIDICPNKRVAYLAAHARKRRVRIKNLNRAIRICERADVL